MKQRYSQGNAQQEFKTKSMAAHGSKLMSEPALPSVADF